MSAVLSLVAQEAAQAASSSFTLLAITGEIQCLIDTAELVDDGSADRADLEAQAAMFQAVLPVKVDSVCNALAHLESQVALAAAEGKRIQARKQRFERDIERLEGYCIRVLEQLDEPKKGPRKLEGNHNALALRPSEGVILTDEAAVPADYKTAVVEMPAADWERVVAAFPDLPARLTKQDLKVRLADVKKALQKAAVPGADIEYRSNLKRS